MPIERINRGRGHAYRIDGNYAYGVTTAISDGWPKSALNRWYAKCVAEEVADMSEGQLLALRALDRDDVVRKLRGAPERQRDKAAVRGTKVHHHAQELIEGKPVTVDDLELLPYVESCAQFMDDWKVKPLLVERVVGSYRWGYAGTFDLVGELPSGLRVLFDYKTGKSGIWPETALQLAAYRHASHCVGEPGVEVPMAEVGVEACKAVWIRPGQYQVIGLDTSPAVHKAFLHALSVARARRAADGWIGDPETMEETP